MNERKIKKNSIEYFDKVASRDLKIEEPMLCYEAVSELLREYDFTDLVDIGCGTGEMLKRIIDDYGDSKRLTGVDISPKSIEEAVKLTGDRAELKVGDVDAMPLEDRSMDIELNMHSFHHYPDPNRSLKEMYRILRYGGSLIMVENDFQGIRRLKINFHHFLLRHREGDVRMYSVKQLTKLIEKAGFTVESTRPVADHSRIYICRK